MGTKTKTAKTAKKKAAAATVKKKRYKRDSQGRRTNVVRRPTSAANAKTAKVFLVNGGRTEKFLTARLDKRSKVYKLIEAHKAESRAHIGEDVSTFEQRHIEQEARYSLLENLAWSLILQKLESGQELDQNAFDAFNKAAREAGRIREALGLKARPGKLITLQDILEGNAESGTDE